MADDAAKVPATEPKVKWDATEKKLVVPAHHSAVKELHEKLAAADSKSAAADNALAQAAEAHAEFKTELDKLAATSTPEKFHVAQHAAIGHAESLNNPDLDKKLQGEIEKLLKKHLPKEQEAAKIANAELKTAKSALRAAELKVQKGLKPADIEGHTKEAEADIQKALDGGIKEGKAAGAFGILHSGKEAGGGFVKALDHNLGKTAWKASKVKAAFNTGTLLVSLGLLWDGAVHSKRKDEKGERTVDRSTGIRVGEVTLALVGLGAQLRGGRHL